MSLLLYKIVSVENWEKSKKQVALDSADDLFIHLALENQLERILSKFWSGQTCIVLKVDPAKLEGQLVFEVNPGGTNKYYHLYEGSIPVDAIIEVKKCSVG